jgi:hypothetical protein
LLVSAVALNSERVSIAVADRAAVPAVTFAHPPAHRRWQDRIRRMIVPLSALAFIAPAPAPVAPAVATPAPMTARASEVPTAGTIVIGVVGGKALTGPARAGRHR